MRIVITGGSGQIGQILARQFHARGLAVAVVSRHPQTAPWSTIAWDGQHPGTWVKELDGADVVINLAGRSVNCRYNQANRREIKESRIVTTQLVGAAIAQASQPPKLWMNASTATIHTHVTDRPMDDVDGVIGGNEPRLPSSWRFSYDVATSWEDAFFEAPTPHTRKIALRSAVTMSPDYGGAFETLLNLVRVGLGGTSGSGDQFVSWVHDSDFVNAIEFLIARSDLDGCINVSSPNPLPNRDFMAALRRAYGAPSDCRPRTGCWNSAPSSCARKPSSSSRAGAWSRGGWSRLVLALNFRIGPRPRSTWSGVGGPDGVRKPPPHQVPPNARSAIF